MAERTVLSKSAVESLAGKLERFGRDLPEQEQNVLGWILTRAQSTSEAELSESELEAVAGGQSSPLSSQLADAVGFGGVQTEGESEISVAWKYSFGAA